MVDSTCAVHPQTSARGLRFVLDVCEYEPVVPLLSDYVTITVPITRMQM